MFLVVPKSTFGPWQVHFGLFRVLLVLIKTSSTYCLWSFSKTFDWSLKYFWFFWSTLGSLQVHFVLFEYFLYMASTFDWSQSIFSSFKVIWSLVLYIFVSSSIFGTFQVHLKFSELTRSELLLTRSYLKVIRSFPKSSDVSRR